jgi:hypothetical protein
MKQLNSFLILLFAFVLLLVVPNVTKAALTGESAEIPYQINNSDHIVIGTVSEIHAYNDHTIVTIAVDEWLYKPLPEKTINVRTETGTNLDTEDQPKFTQKESVLLMLSDKNSMFSDKDIDKDIFIVSVAFPGKHPVSDRAAVIKELKAQGKWQEGNQTVSKTNNTAIEDGIIDNLSSNNLNNTDNTQQNLPLTFGPETINKLKSDPNFIAAYGNIPSFTTSEERYRWVDSLGEVMDEVEASFKQELSKYFYPNGPITGCGATIDGVIQVGINKSDTVDKPFMDEIYQIFNSKASRMGIKEVPVIFIHEDNAVPAIISEPLAKEQANLSTANEENTVKINNSSNNNSGSLNEKNSKMNNSDGDKSNKNNSIPGFGLLGNLICLYSGWRLQKK